MRDAREMISVELAQGVLHQGVRQRDALLAVPTGFDEMALGAVGNDGALDVALAVFARLGLQSDAASTLTVGDKERLLFALCRHLYGATVELLASCPHCYEHSEMTVNFEDLLKTGSEISGWFDLSRGWQAELRAPTLGDIAAARQGAEASRRLIEACIVGLVDATGAHVSSAQLPADMEPRVADGLECMDPASETIVHVSCPACGLDFEAEIDALTLLRKKFSSRDELFAEVFRMARAYHWSEADILNLPVERRRMYLTVAETAAGAA